MAVVAAVAARRAAALREAQIIHEKNKKTIARNKERNVEQRAYLRELADQQAGRESAATEQLVTYMEGRSPRAGVVHPSGEAVLSTVVSTCLPEDMLAVHALDKQRSHNRSQELALDAAFRTLDREGSGSLEHEAILRVMGDLVPQLPREEVVAGRWIVYEACSLKVGAPITREHMPMLLPALSDWTAIGRRRVAAAAARSKSKARGSAICTVS